MMVDPRVSDAMRQAREAVRGAGWRQHDIATAVGLSQQSVSRLFARLRMAVPPQAAGRGAPVGEKPVPATGGGPGHPAGIGQNNFPAGSVPARQAEMPGHTDTATDGGA